MKEIIKGYTFSRQKSSKIKLLIRNMQDIIRIDSAINTHSSKTRQVFVLPIYSYDDRKTYLLVESPDRFLLELAETYKKFKQDIFTQDLVIVAVYDNFMKRFNGFHITVVERREQINVQVLLTNAEIQKIVVETIELREQERAIDLKPPKKESDFDFSEWDCTHS